jgi:uncharacterized protein YdeI (YjbR/CyaY-like superfamily)
MGKRDRRIDAYIAKSAEFARPILTHLREVVHAACPEVEETVKWGMPHFMYKGMLCGMAAFKQHATFGFWRRSLIVGAKGNDAMGQFGRITSVSGLPAKRVLAGYVKQAMKLNDDGVKSPAATRPKQPKPPLEVPPVLSAALKANPKARVTFEKFSPTHRREYVEWVADAKREDTRARRVAAAVEWMAEGKPRNWKYAGG